MTTTQLAFLLSMLFAATAAAKDSGGTRPIRKSDLSKGIQSITVDSIRSDERELSNKEFHAMLYQDLNEINEALKRRPQ